MLYLFPWPEVLVKDPAQLGDAKFDLWIWVAIVSVASFTVFYIAAKNVAYSSSTQKGRDIKIRRIWFVVALISDIVALVLIANLKVATKIIPPHMREDFWFTFIIALITSVIVYLLLILLVITLKSNSKVATILPAKKH